MTRTGSCLCGAVTFEVEGPLRPVVACHCGQCRKVTGNFVAATGAARDAVTIAGEVTWFRSSPEARRGFCAICGSQLFWDGLGTHLSIMAGALDGATGLSLAGHIFCADAADWEVIDDGLPRADGADAMLATVTRT